MKKVLIKLFLFLAITNSAHASYLRSAGKYIFTSEGEKIILKGMGLGGWLVREGYMLQTPGAGSPTDINNKITTVYLTSTDLKKTENINKLTDYLQCFYDFCFDMDHNSVLKGRINFNYLKNGSSKT